MNQWKVSLLYLHFELQDSMGFIVSAEKGMANKCFLDFVFVNKRFPAIHQHQHYRHTMSCWPLVVGICV